MADRFGGKNKLTDDDKRDTLSSWAIHYPNISGIARDLGISRQSARRRLLTLDMKDGDGWKRYPDNSEEYASGFVGPDLDSAEKPLADIIEDATKEFRRRKRAKDTRTWMPFKMRENKPAALVFLGDPHLDECNLDLLRKHIDKINATEGAYAVGLGDYTNAWSGRLGAQIYPVQEMTRPQAHKMAEWFFSAIENWLVLIKGNHDMWADKHGMGDVLDWMRRPPESVMVDWQAQFKVVFPKGKEFRIWAAHDFPGSSQYTKSFSAQKRGMFTGGMADLYITGHKHCWEILSTEHEHTNRRYFAARARGYKWHDPHATTLGYGGEEFGASLVMVLDPTAAEPRDKFMFDDVEAGLDYLEFLRAKN